MENSGAQVMRWSPPTRPGNREALLYVTTNENPYVARTGERGQLSYVNLSADFHRKARSYFGCSGGILKCFPDSFLSMSKPSETQGERGFRS